MEPDNPKSASAASSCQVFCASPQRMLDVPSPRKHSTSTLVSPMRSASQPAKGAPNPTSIAPSVHSAMRSL